jgi:hypothetical protein
VQLRDTIVPVHLRRSLEVFLGHGIEVIVHDLDRRWCAGVSASLGSSDGDNVIRRILMLIDEVIGGSARADTHRYLTFDTASSKMDNGPWVLPVNPDTMILGRDQGQSQEPYMCHSRSVSETRGLLHPNLCMPCLIISTICNRLTQMKHPLTCAETHPTRVLCMLLECGT